MTQENINSAETRRFLLRLTRSAGNTGFPIWCQPVRSYRFAQYYQTLWPPPGNPVRVQILLVTDGDQVHDNFLFLHFFRDPPRGQIRAHITPIRQTYDAHDRLREVLPRGGRRGLGRTEVVLEGQRTGGALVSWSPECPTLLCYTHSWSSKVLSSDADVAMAMLPH